MLQLFKTPQQVVTEIHNEFDTAEDRLLLQANEIIKEINASGFQSVEKKAARLSALGFTNTPDVVKANASSVVKTREQAELIQYYKQNYLFQKFLTESELERICIKYNLVFAPVSAYIKDVPDKNLREIEKAVPLKDEDLAVNDIYCKYKFDNSFWFGGGDQWMGIFSKWRRILPKKINGLHFDSRYHLSEYLNSVYNIGITYIVDAIENCINDKQGLFIAAPKSHFNLSKVTSTGTFSFMNVLVSEPKDPIVFRYCRGGIQVLSKWGLEAKDEILVNEKMN